MNSDLKDILSDSNKDTGNQRLMDYLSHHISAADEHDLEKSMADDDFINDAVEGLQEIQPTKNLESYVEGLNRDLQKQLSKTKIRREKHRIKDKPFALFAILLILLLAAICYIILKKNEQQRPPVNKVTTSQQSAFRQ